MIVWTKLQIKIWNLKFEVLSSETSNIEFYSSKLQIWSFEISFCRAKNFKFKVIECLLEMLLALLSITNNVIPTTLVITNEKYSNALSPNC